MSNRDACKVINACLKDMGIDVPSNVLEASKLKRQRQIWRRKVVEERRETVKQLECIGFDGRTDETKVCRGRVMSRNVREEHYTIISYLGKQYVNHVSPHSCKADDVAAQLVCVLQETASMQSLTAVVCDGTNLNTGERNGVIRRLELAVNRPLQWLICMLHLNELPLRAVFKHLDGFPTGPHAFSGSIGRVLQEDITRREIIKFKPVDGFTEQVPDDVCSDLSQDQKYLLRAALAVQKGYADTTAADLTFLEKASPGILNHARWLTCANRTLRLYMSSENPSQSLLHLVSYIVQVYAPCWFRIKRFPYCYHGARNFYYMLQRTACYPDDAIRNVVYKPLQRNAYFAHPENVLIAALIDDDYSV